MKKKYLQKKFIYKISEMSFNRIVSLRNFPKDVVKFYNMIFSKNSEICKNLPIVSINKNSVVIKQDDRNCLDSLNLNSLNDLQKNKNLFSSFLKNMFETYWKKNVIHGDLNECNLFYNKDENKLILVDLFETITFLKNKYRTFFLFLIEISEILRVYVKQCYGCRIYYHDCLKNKDDSFLIKTVKELTNYLNVMCSQCNNSSTYLIEEKAKVFFKKYEFQFNLLVKKLNKIFAKEFKLNVKQVFEKKINKL
jgi:RIO-like serine/threonine protein kinase